MRHQWKAMLGVAALISSALTTVGVFTAPPAEACTFGTCGDSLTMLRFSDPPRIYGQALEIRAIVKDHSSACALPTDVGCTQPTGSVHFLDGDVLLSVQPLLQCVPQPGSAVCLISFDESETLPLSIKSLAGGDHVIRAEYHRSGSDGFNDSEASAGLTIAPAVATASIDTPAASSVVGQPVDLSGDVRFPPPDTANGVLPPSGSIAFHDSVAGEVASDSVDATGHAAATATTLTVGTHTLHAHYPGDFNYSASTSGPTSHTVTVGGTTSALNQSAATTVFGEPFTVTDAVTAVSPATAIPGGSVTFNDGTIQIGTAGLGGSGLAGLSVATLPVGTHSLTATYAGDANLNGSTSNTLSHAVNKANTLTTVVSPTADPSALGDTVTLNASVAVTAPGAGTPTGVVQFKDGGAVLGAPVSLIGSTATLLTTALGGGSHSITAAYSGDTNFNTSESTAIRRTVSCTTTVTNNVAGTYTAPATGTTCITGVSIGGSLIIPPGATVSIVNSTIAGNVSASGGSGTILLCGTTVGGAVTITNRTSRVLVGGPAGCARNTVRGGLDLLSNSAGIQLIGNTVNGNATINGTTGGSTIISANTVQGTLRCATNNPAPSNGGRPNSASGRTGQCGASSF